MSYFSPRVFASPEDASHFFALCGYEKPAIIRYLMERLNVPEGRAEALADDAVKTNRKEDPDGTNEGA